MKVKAVMKTDVVSLKPDQTYGDAVKLILKHKVSALPVIDPAGQLVGLVSEKDLFRVLYPFYKSFYANPEAYTDYEKREEKIGEIWDHSISGFMTKKVATISSDDPIMKAGALMLAREINHLPVVDGEKFAGMVYRSDIYQAILKHHSKK